MQGEEDFQAFVAQRRAASWSFRYQLWCCSGHCSFRVQPFGRSLSLDPITSDDVRLFAVPKAFGGAVAV